MSCLRLLSRQLKIALLALAGWLAVHAAALAQAAPAGKGERQRQHHRDRTLRDGLPAADLCHCPGHVGRLPLEQPPRPRPARGLCRDLAGGGRRRSRSRKRSGSRLLRRPKLCAIGSEPCESWAFPAVRGKAETPTS